MARLPRPWRRRRPTSGPAPVRPENTTAPATSVGLDEPPTPYGRRCALAHPDRRPAHRAVSSYQDTHPGLVHRGMVHIAPGQHRAPEDTVRIEFVGDDDFPTAPIVLPRDTAAWPAALHALMAPAPAGAR